MRILALDISSSATGWAYGYDNKLIAYGKYITKQSGERGKRLYEFSEWIERLVKEKNPELIIIERPFRGRNSNVLAILSKFVAVAEIAAYKVLKLEIQPDHFLDPRTIKKTLKVKRGNNHDQNKRLMVNKINSIYGLKLKYNPKKSKTFNDDDEADAIAILHAWWKIHD